MTQPSGRPLTRYPTGRAILFSQMNGIDLADEKFLGVEPAVSPRTGTKERGRTASPLRRLVRSAIDRHRLALLAVIALNAIPGLGVAFQTVAPKYLVDSVLLPEGLDLSERIQRLTLLVGLWLFAALFLRMTCWYWSYRLFTIVRERIIVALRARLFRHISHLCMRFHGRHSSGDLISYVIGSPIASISGYYHGLMMNVPNAVAAFVISSMWILLWDWPLTLLLLGLVSATVIITQKAYSDLSSMHESFQRTEATVLGQVADFFRGSRDVKIHAVEETLARRFDRSAQLIQNETCRRDIRMHHVNMRHEAAGALFFGVLLALVSWRYLQGVVTAGQLFAYLGAYFALQAPVSMLFGVAASRAAAETGAVRLLRLLDTETSTPDPERAPKTAPRRAELRLDRVDFGYSDRLALKDASLTIPFGQSIALVGPSGAGKSTIAKLLLRLYDPNAGAVTIGGVDVRECRSQDVRHLFGVVPQEPYFFQGTIRDNLRLTREDATDEMIRSVCEVANAWEFIGALQHGLDEPVGEGASRLSGGQRQRLAIARALLNEPDYLIFDEATSALDTISERLVRDAIRKALVGRTAIFIAHRLSTIRDCGRIVVVRDGGIAQDGSYEQLSTEPGLFREMVQNDLR